jgi:hypothetical protein
MEGTLNGEYSIWDEMLPQSSEPAHKRRTRYFYRKMALIFLQDSRRNYLNSLFPGYTETHLSLAKSYFRSYRQALKKAA